MKYCLLFLFFLSLSTLSMAQTGKLKGTVSDQKGGKAQYVNVLIEGSAKGTLTDKDGEYVLDDIPVGEHTVKISSFTYAPISKVVVIRNGETTVLDVSVTEDELQLQTVEILGRAETSYKNTNSFIGTKSSTPLRDVPQSIGYVTKELALDQGAYTVNDVVKNVSGVNQFTFYNDITIRGHRIKGQDISGNLVNGMQIGRAHV